MTLNYPDSPAWERRFSGRGGGGGMIETRSVNTAERSVDSSNSTTKNHCNAKVDCVEKEMKTENDI